MLHDVLAEKGIVVRELDLAGRRRRQPRASRSSTPEDAKGLKVRGGSREMDMILKEAGAAVISLPSNEIYAAMQTGAMDAAMTSSTSLISFRLEEVAKNLTSGRGKAYWFMFEPLMMSQGSVRQAAEGRSRTLIMAVGAELEKFADDARQGRRQAGRRRSTRRRAPRCSTSTTRRSRSGRRSRATPRGRTTASARARPAPSC